MAAVLCAPTGLNQHGRQRQLNNLARGKAVRFPRATAVLFSVSLPVDRSQAIVFVCLAPSVLSIGAAEHLVQPWNFEGRLGLYFRCSCGLAGPDHRLGRLAGNLQVSTLMLRREYGQDLVKSQAIRHRPSRGVVGQTAGGAKSCDCWQLER